MRFSKNQKVALLAGTLAAVGMGIFPPWIMEGDSLGTEATSIHFPLGYNFIFAPPISPHQVGVAAQYLSNSGGVRLDMLRLLVQWIILLLLLIGTLLYFHEPEVQADFRPELTEEETVRHLLSCTKWKTGSFLEIWHRLPGLDEHELRKMLVRAGAVCLQNDQGREVWGLVTRNQDRL